MSILVNEEYVNSIRDFGFQAFKVQRIKAEVVRGPLSIDTLEGPEHLNEGDVAWLVTAFENKGENYFIHPDTFMDLYEETNEYDIYARRPDRFVTAFEMNEEFEVTVSWLNANLVGSVGDFLVEYGPGDYNIVERETFLNSYIEV